jgi:cytidyltransferase-like protein
MKIVMTFWAFDVVHPWHRYYLSEAKKHGDRLITTVARDNTIEKIKWKKPLNKENSRLLDVKNLGIADIVELWHETDMLNSIKKYNPDVIVLWYDQTSFIHQLSEYLYKNKLKTTVLTLWPFREDIYKSSKIKKNN